MLLRWLPTGARTPLAGFFTACVVGFVLLFLTPVFQLIPYNVIGAIIISGVSGLFEYEEAILLYRVRPGARACVHMLPFGAGAGTLAF